MFIVDHLGKTEMSCIPINTEKIIVNYFNLPPFN